MDKPKDPKKAQAWLENAVNYISDGSFKRAVKAKQKHKRRLEESDK